MYSICPTLIQIYSQVDDLLFTLLKEGHCKWKKPWRIDPNSSSIPSHLLIHPFDNDRPALAQCVALLKRLHDMPPVLTTHRGPGYCLELDYICMPFIHEFIIPEEYYTSLYHELIHSTGRPHRLARKAMIPATKKDFACQMFEELVAEIGAAYMSALSGIMGKTIHNSAGLIGICIKGLWADPNALPKAITHARAAVDYLVRGRK